MLIPLEILPPLKEILGGNYLISEDARIFSRLYRHKPAPGHLWELNPTTEESGAERAALMINGKFRRVQVQLLVAAAYLPPRPSREHMVGHKNGDRLDNRRENLHWVHQDEIAGKYWRLKNRHKNPVDVYAMLTSMTES